MKMIDFLYKSLARPLLFKLDPELAHNITFNGLRLASKSELIKKAISFIYDKNYSEPYELMGIKFKNRLGIAAGFDKNALVYDVIESFGFGFIEIGSVTLNPQEGNPGPRIFRIIDESGILNHMGLNNAGAYTIRKNIDKKGKPNIPLGINIAKDNSCDFSKASKNISECFSLLKDAGDFFVINISCPNVNSYNGDLKDYVNEIICELKNRDSSKPIFIKISPDISDKELFEITLLCEKQSCGVVATNTTKRKDVLKTRDFDLTDGGVSGKPLKNLSFDKLKKIRDISRIPVISVGGIFNSMDIKKRKEAGADLFEIYTSFIYNGPAVVKDLLTKN